MPAFQQMRMDSNIKCNLMSFGIDCLEIIPSSHTGSWQRDCNAAIGAAGLRLSLFGMRRFTQIGAQFYPSNAAG